MSSRKPHAASDATTPMSAASTSSTTKRLLRMVEAGSPGEAAVSAMSYARAPGSGEPTGEPRRQSSSEAGETLAAMPAADSAPGSPLPAGPLSADAEARAGARRRMRYGLLLLALTASFTVEGIASEGAAANALVTTLLG